MLILVPTQITFQALKQAIGATLGFPADPFVHRLDVALHGQVAWLAYRVFLSNWAFVRSLDLLYVVWHAVFIGFLSWAAWTEHRALRLRALLAFLLVCISAGTIRAALAASAGPCFYAHVVGGPSPYAPLLDRLDSLSIGHRNLIARRTQAWLWELASTRQWGTFAGVSAMPSLHVAMATLFALVGWQRS